MISERRVAEIMRAGIDAIPVEPPPSATFRARAASRPVHRPRTWPTALVGAAAVAATIVAATVVLPGPSAAPDQAAGSTPYRLPREVARASSGTPAVSEKPPGRAIALFRQDGRQVVLATDGHTYRRLDLAGAALLSPDGLLATVGDPARATGEVAVVDLRTGRAERYAVDASVAARPLAWSPNGRRVAFATQTSPTGDGAGPAGVSVLDLDTRRFVQIADPRQDTGSGRVHAVFTSTGADVLVSNGAEDGCTLRVYRVEPPKPAEPVSVDGPVDGCREVVTLGLHTLSTQAANQDQFVIEGIPPILVAVGERHGNIVRLYFRGDSFGMPGAVPDSLMMGSGDRLLGWDGRDGVYVSNAGGVDELPLDRPGYTRMLRFPAVTDGPDLVTDFQLASDLMPDTALADPDAGTWPLSPRRTGAVAVLLLVVAVVVALRRRRAGLRSRERGEVTRSREARSTRR
jgi:hypothetical protein